MKKNLFAEMLTFIPAATAILVSPWLFGAWAMWWFWPFTVLIFLSFAVFAFRLAAGEARIVDDHARRGKASRMLLFSVLPFLGYAAVRLLQGQFVEDGVYESAERSFLLFLTPTLLAVALVFGCRRRHLRLLHALIMIDLFLLGLYGLVNHVVTGSEMVLWAHGFRYGNRATGTYFCPDHFAGIMELGLVLAVGLCLDRRTSPRRRLAVVPLIAVTCAGIYLSQSRGSALTLIVVAVAVLVVGFGQWSSAARWRLRLATLVVAMLGFGGLWMAGGAYVERFKAYSWSDLTRASRYQYMASAVRAWKTNRVIGIGPGMHQHLWPHFRASPDGDREAFVPPTFRNTGYHLYEVHNDWLQLLEEYGIMGVALFLYAGLNVLGVLLSGFRRGVAAAEAGDARPGFHGYVLGALLATVAMAFHSLGDFNLQIPATTWLCAGILAVPLGLIVREERSGG